MLGKSIAAVLAGIAVAAGKNAKFLLIHVSKVFGVLHSMRAYRSQHRRALHTGQLAL